ncbi:MAG: FAD-dependent oxidoreductase, partial [Ilumatobacteraceae bacterium]
RLVGAERITIEHWRDDAGYSDSIGLCPGMTPTYPTLQIPYRSLLPVTTNGLLAAGRNLSADTKSHAALREIPQCWAMGEAAGVAATLAVDKGIEVRDIDIGELQAQLVKQGGVVDPPTQQIQRDEMHCADAGLEDSIHWQAVNEARAFD